MECFPKASGSAVILVKAMVSFGQMFYPMLVSYMLLNNIWYGYGLIIPGILFVLITTLAAIDLFGIADKISYISTGGGAFLEFVEGKVLPAVAMLIAHSGNVQIARHRQARYP